jgi:pyruvate kinase
MYNDPKNSSTIKNGLEILETLFKSGTTTVRFNFSHGNQEEQLVRYDMVKQVAKKMNIPISLLLDTKGPEIRVYEIKEKDGVVIETGSTVIIESLNKVSGDSKTFSVTDVTGTYNMAKDVHVGSKILIDDGKLILVATNVDVKTGKIEAIAKNTHKISTKKRINLPNATYSMPFLSDKDKDDIKLACTKKFDYIAASFTNSADNIREIRAILSKMKCPEIKVIAKIESTDAIKNLNEIIRESDAIMIARGDLGVEIPYYDVPYYEKLIIRKCKKYGKPVIVATQMLDSMEKNLIPTRAEVTDVHYAVELGTDSTMTSGETANGNFPVESTRAMTAICCESEKFYDYKKNLDFFKVNSIFGKEATKFACKIASKCLPTGKKRDIKFPYEFVVIFSNEEKVIRAVSNAHPAAAIIAVISDEKLYTLFGINYGVKT